MNWLLLSEYSKLTIKQGMSTKKKDLQREQNLIKLNLTYFKLAKLV